MPHEGKQLTRRDDATANSLIAEEAPSGVLPRSSQRAVLHDGRSALHAIIGHVELLDQGLLGAVSAEQRAALRHVRGSALWLFELLESSLELSNRDDGEQDESAPLCVAQLLRHELLTLLRDRPALRVAMEEAPASERWLVNVPASALRQLLSMQLDVLLETHGAKLELRLAATDLHVSWTLRVPQHDEQHDAGRSRPGASFPPSALGPALERATLRNTLRLKRCEAVLARHQGRLLVSQDLSAIRAVLPLQRTP